MNELHIKRPDDWHLHLRDGNALKRTVADAAQTFHRAIVMPNLKTPIKDVTDALTYRERILEAIPAKKQFTPLMTLYLTDETTPAMIADAAHCEHVYACKLYPAHATTNSQSGVTNIQALHPVFSAMEKHNLPLLLHGEIAEPQCDIFDREKLFIEKTLAPMTQHFPGLRIVLEHITTQDAVSFVKSIANNLAATITAHHLWLNRNDLLAGGIRPHYYCLPIVKRTQDQAALINAAISGDPRFFLGTDSAPHTRSTKECATGCAGIYTAHAACELYAEIFEAHDALDRLENFASCFGPAFYGLPENKDTITLQKKDWVVPDHYDFNGEDLIPFAASQTLHWQVIHERQ